MTTMDEDENLPENGLAISDLIENHEIFTEKNPRTHSSSMTFSLKVGCLDTFRNTSEG